MTGDAPHVTNLDDFKRTYFEECVELLEQLYATLTEITEGHGNQESWHAIFRAVHSIKGGGGAFGFDRLVSFAHTLETLLDMLRDGRVGVTPEVTALLLRAADVLSDLTDAARSGQEKPPGFSAELAQELQAAAGGVLSASPECEVAAQRSAPAGSTRYRIRLAPHPDLFQRANDPLLLIRALKRLGTVSAEPDLARLPDLAAIDPDLAYLAWTIRLTTKAPMAAVEEVFEFAADDCDLSIGTEQEAEVGAAAPQVGPGAAKAGSAPQPGVASAVGTDAAGGQPRSIRVDVEKVDRVVNLVGELVISQAALAQFGQSLPPDLCPALLNGLETLSQNLRELQESVMAIRAQPVKSVFSRMPRLVRELAAQLGKDVRLVITGEATEIDKTVIEQLADPLTHLLRNALDHGIELPDVREANGKPRQGTMHLGAEQRSGRIVIEIVGRRAGHRPREGARERARARARVAGRGADRRGNRQPVFRLALSTAANVSHVSGRGVGMDVVRRNVQALGGRIIVESRLGAGSRFMLSLPLTLAILDGMDGRGRHGNLHRSADQHHRKPAPAAGRYPSGRRARRRAGDPRRVCAAVYLHRRFSIADAVTDPCHGIVVIVRERQAPARSASWSMSSWVSSRSS